MTDEELAEEHAKAYVPLIAPIDDHVYQLSRQEIVKALNDCSIDSFLAGLKSERTQWQDLRKDPEEVKQKFNEWLEENGGKEGALYQTFPDEELEKIFLTAYEKNK